ncbi:hypothetical protein TSUD_289860 [Trifolium subterraneum]|uniref:PPPDE domain-containing protein n=1 Tax=Trifolium subterraneum TaxID=3900 RepID=A0A2Z6M398_TRISU|nr:hypothetical protein TSUD_289860 [Trifolium subterraneum]
MGGTGPDNSEFRVNSLLPKESGHGNSEFRVNPPLPEGSGLGPWFLEMMNGHLGIASKVNQIIRELSREWPGNSYDLLSKNCNHFCDEFCERLAVPKLPGWVNRFANAGDTAMEVAGNTALRFRQAKTEIVTASKVAYRFLLGVTNNVTTSVKPGPDSPNISNNEVSSPRFQASWLKNLITNGAKPSTSSEAENQNGVHAQPTREEDDKALLQHNSSSHHDS